MAERISEYGVSERPRLEDLRRTLEKLLVEDRFDEVRTLFASLHPAEIAALVTGLGALERNLAFDLTQPEKQHEVLSELEEADQETLLERMTDERISDIIVRLDSDDAADIAGLLDDEVRKRVLQATELEDRAEVERLLEYDEESAGGLMAVELVTVRDAATVAEAIETVRRVKESGEIDDIHYVYAVDKEQRLKGRVSILDLMLAPRKELIRNILDPEMITVRADLDQEEVAQIFERYDLISAPVVEEDGKLVGRITIDDVVDVLRDEAEEDMGFMGGVGEEEVGERNVLKASRSRLPWLIVAFLGEMISAPVIARYETELATLLVIAFFIPVVIAVAGNVGIQSATVVVRGIGTGEILLSRTFQRVWREVMVGLINGTIISLIFAAIVYFWQQDLQVAFAVSISLVCVIIIAAVTGALIPFVLKRFNQDPAHASGPFITMTNDVIGLSVYLVMTTSMLL